MRKGKEEQKLLVQFQHLLGEQRHHIPQDGYFLHKLHMLLPEDLMLHPCCKCCLL